MIFQNIFKKKYEYILFDSKKNDLTIEYLNENRINQIDKLDFEESFLTIKKLTDELEKEIKILKDQISSEVSKKILNLVNEEIIFLKEQYENILDSKFNNYHQFVQKFRELFKIFINIKTLTSWQSPDYGYSVFPQHGNGQNKILPFYNDYQRYRVNTELIENKFKELYSGFDFKPEVYFFNSGMGAFTSLIKASDGFESSIKIAGKNSYFELISFLKFYPEINFFDEDNIDEIIDFVNQNEPEYLFFEPVSNSTFLKTFDFESLFNYYSRNPPQKETSIIIDITLVMDNFRVESFLKKLPNKLNIFLFRSLQKLDQCGLDMVTGGILIHYGQKKIKIDEIRQSGTNPTEIELCTIDFINYFHVKPRFSRHSRNTLLIAYHLNKMINKKNPIIEKVFHPFLSDKLKKIYYHVPLFFFKLNNLFEKDDNNFFVESIIAKAGEKGINIIAGSSFGFDFSRLMITSLPDSQSLCIRFSAGTETIKDVYGIISVLDDLVSDFPVLLSNFYNEKKSLYYNQKEDNFFELLNLLSEDQSYIENVIFKFSELKKIIEKFNHFKSTKKFYQEKTEYLIVSLLNSLEINKNIAENEKKSIIKKIYEMF